MYDSSMERCWRLYPHHINSVGFFLRFADT